MSKNKYLIDKKVILDCERMTLSRDRESLKISESECNLLLAFHQGLFKKDDLIAWVWGRKGVVVSSASYYKLINQLEPRAFIISYEPKFISGGFWTKKVRKRNDAISH